MKSLVTLSLFLTLTAFAQDPVATPALAIPLPESWGSNAIIVLCVNFVLALAALGSKKIPGVLGTIVQKLVDMFSANVEHKK